jgi:GNAT superfamily N-acetyltransferase
MEEIVISTDKSKLDVSLIHKYLSEDSYWAKGIPLEIVKKSIENSMCFGVYKAETQVGFARVTTDKAIFAYVADVFILPEHRKQGLSKKLMAEIIAHPELQGLRKMLLATADAHGLYSQFGFEELAKPGNFMEKRLQYNYLGDPV